LEHVLIEKVGQLFLDMLRADLDFPGAPKAQTIVAKIKCFPRCAGVIYAKLQREGLGDKFYMDAPTRQRQYVERCNKSKEPARGG
jgi:hypothetical protein